MASKGGRKSKGRRRKSGTSLLGQTAHLDITDIAYGGYGLGRTRGKTVLTPYTLPGEAISAEIVEARDSVLFARGKQLKAASADRVRPQCPHFGPGRCWGCHFQHSNYQAQLLLKQDALAEELSRVGKISDSLLESVMRPPLPASEIWGYNQRLILHRGKAGKWGLRRQRNKGIEAINECHISHPDLLDALAELDLDYVHARRLTIQRGSDGNVMLIFNIDAEEAPSLRTDIPLSVNLILPNNEPVNLIGDAHSVFRIGERGFRVTAGSYMRPNVGQIETLGQVVSEALRLSGNERVLELYAGVGVFTAIIAERASLVASIESYPPAVNDAAHNLSDCDNIDIIEGPVEAALEDMRQRAAAYEAVLLDPPSRGLNPAIINGLWEIGARRLAYVSGDPISLARDSRRLIDVGFQLESAQAVDMAPQTYYITAVATFRR